MNGRSRNGTGAMISAYALRALSFASTVRFLRARRRIERRFLRQAKRPKFRTVRWMIDRRRRPNGGRGIRGAFG